MMGIDNQKLFSPTPWMNTDKYLHAVLEMGHRGERGEESLGGCSLEDVLSRNTGVISGRNSCRS